jgi:anti-sigma regulatory factor (Ser/Thr protein kinase)
VKRAAETLSLEFPGDVASLDGARDEIRRHLERAGVDETAAYAVDLVLEELVGNAIRYGYQAGARGSIQVEIHVVPRFVHVTVEDDGRPFDPTRHPEPKRPRNLVDASVGGRGIALVRRFARTLRYARASGRNRTVVDVARAE